MIEKITHKKKLLAIIIRKQYRKKKGVSFFTPNKSDKYDENWYNQVVEYEVEPLIKEYWFDSSDKVNSALDALKK